MAWKVGQKLQGGKYTIQKVLGQGGFGITYLAKKSRHQSVVIKTLNSYLENQPDFPKYQQDFLNEALRLAKFNHPHIVRVEEVIQEAESWCMVMEYIDGEDLGRWVWSQGALAENEALQYIQQIGEALILVHKNGLLHRDIKPLNIMRRREKLEAVLIDFGIAREFTPNMTQTQTQFLSNGFAPIEQYDWKAKRGAYTDIYALAATLYSLLTGEIPTPAPVRAYGMALESPQHYNSKISDRVNQAIIIGMTLKPEDRPQSVQDWLDLFIDKLTIATLSSIDYSQLETFLAAENWREADRETANLMLKLSRRDGWLRVEDVEKLPTQDLQAIDKLWVKHSQGRFGLSIQKNLWQSIIKLEKSSRKAWTSFGDAVGWRIRGNWVSYSSLNFTLDAPLGQFPALVVSDSFTLRHQESLIALFSRAEPSYRHNY